MPTTPFPKRYDHNPYQILGIPKHASTTEIQQAYRALARSHHPDKCLTPNATPAEQEHITQQFAALQQAYSLLIDPEKRAQFDQHGLSLR